MSKRYCYEVIINDIPKKAKTYDEQGIAPGTAWEDLPADFTCPVCGLDKDAFEVEA